MFNYGDIVYSYQQLLFISHLLEYIFYLINVTKFKRTKDKEHIKTPQFLGGIAKKHLLKLEMNVKYKKVKFITKQPIKLLL